MTDVFFQVCVLEGESADLIPKMTDMFGIQTFDFVFLDHWKDCYLPDIRLMEVLSPVLCHLIPNLPYVLTSDPPAGLWSAGSWLGGPC